MEEAFTIPEGLSQDGTYWAQMTGHPHWPVRLCSPPEVRKLEAFRPRKVQQQVPVFFLCSLNSAWVNRNQIEVFDADSCSRRVDEKKFKTSRAYRWAIIEAMRVTLAKGIVFPPKLYALVTSCEGHIDWNTTADVCTVCSGTEMSGEALVCDLCNSAETHFHCLRPQIISAPSGNWYCEGCLKVKGLPSGYMPPQASAELADEAAVEDASTGAGKRRGKTSTPVAPPPSSSSRAVASGHVTPTYAGASSTRRSARDSLQSISSAGLGIDDGPKASLSSLNGDPPAQGSRRSAEGCDIFGRTNGTFNGTVRPGFGCQLTAEEDDCFVCGLEGSGLLLLCDYPGCRRTYHQACVTKTYPASLAHCFPNLPISRDPVYKKVDSIKGQVDIASVEKDFESSMSEGIDEGRFDVFSKLERTWICPAHFCVRCNSLSNGNGMPELDPGSVPSYLLAYGDRKIRKPLSSCGRCPMSVCLECENDIGGGVPLVVLIPPAAVGAEATVAAASMSSASTNHSLEESRNLLSSNEESATIAFRYLESRIKFGTESCKLDVGGSEAGVEIAGAGNGKSGGRGYVRTPRNTDKELKEILTGKKVVIPSCLNCNSRNARLSLAKSFEKMCGNIFRSRLCLPFLRPFLPCSSLQSAVESSSSFEHKSNAIDRLIEISGPRGLYEKGILDGIAVQSESGNEVTDLLSILEKIRRLRYSCFKEVLLDFEKLKGILVHFLIGKDPDCLSEEFSIDDTLRPQLRSIVLAFDSLIDSAVLFDDLHKITHRKLEKAIESAGKDVEAESEPTVDEAVDIEEDAVPLRKRQRLEGSLGANRMKNALLSISSDLIQDAAAPDMTANVASACREAMALWRSECERSLDGGLVFLYKVEPRSISGWCHFLVHGSMPLHSRRPPVDSNAPGPPSSRGTNEERTSIAKWLRVLDASELSDELQAAHIMSGMRYSEKRETVTLFAMDTIAPELLEPEQSASLAGAAPGTPTAALAGITGAPRRPQQFSSSEGCAEDGSLVLLEQLQRLARQSLLLGSQLQSQLKQQSTGYHGSAPLDVVTIGEARIVSELRLANDNLRWRCQQKERALAVLSGIVAQLRSEGEAQSARLAEQLSEIDRLRALLQEAQTPCAPSPDTLT